MALTERVAVLTGGPGCGKSYTVRAVVTLARAKRAKVLLAAPTGRAAKRLGELAGLEAATLHRLLQLRPGGDAAFDRDHPLDADLVVVDEASMLDVLLANKLVKAIPSGAHLLLVGDVDQLPSVAAGEVLRDLLAAERLPRVRLTRVFRQAQHSGVVTNAHRINAGQLPVTRGLDDFFLFAEEDPERTADRVVDVVANRLPRRFGLDPVREVQVLCPMHRGPAGAGVLNERLQAALTPPREGLAERRFGGRVYRVGDKVMQLRNNYDKGTAGVFNGSVGVVTALSLEDQELRVLLDEDEESRLRVRRAGRADPRLRRDHPPHPRQRVPLRDRPPCHQRLADAAAQPAVYGRDPGQANRGPGRQPTRAGQSGPHQGRRPPAHRTHRTAKQHTNESACHEVEEGQGHRRIIA